MVRCCMSPARSRPEQQPGAAEAVEPRRHVVDEAAVAPPPRPDRFRHAPLGDGQGGWPVSTDQGPKRWPVGAGLDGGPAGRRVRAALDVNVDPEAIDDILRGKMTWARWPCVPIARVPVEPEPRVDGAKQADRAPVEGDVASGSWKAAHRIPGAVRLPAEPTAFSRPRRASARGPGAMARYYCAS